MKIQRNGGNVPPQAIELESAILGAIMLENCIDLVSAILKVDDFYVEANQKIFKACQTMRNDGRAIDFMTVTMQLKKDGELELVGGSYYVTSLTSDVVSSANVEEHSRIVKQMSIKRQMIRIGANMLRDGYDDTYDAFEYHSFYHKEVTDIIKSVQRAKIEKIADVMQSIIDEGIQNANNGVEFTGFSTGIRAIDELVGGLQPGDTTVLAAGTSEGKSTLALNIADHISRQGTPVAVMTFEMKTVQLARKILSSRIEVNAKDLRLGKLNDTQIKQAIEAKIEYVGVPLYLNMSAGMNIEELCNTIRAMKANLGIEVAIIDYIQLVRSKGGNRELEVANISRSLRQLSLELNIHIIELSQLKRMENGTQRIYQLSDLRESGAIEQDAVNVMFIYKPISMPQNRNLSELNINGETIFPTKETAVCILAKSREGKTGATIIKELFWASKFVDVDYEPKVNESAPKQLYKNGLQNNSHLDNYDLEIKF